MMTDNQKKQIKALRQSGLGYKKVAQEVGVSVDSVKSYCRNNGLTGVAATQTTNKAICRECGEQLVQPMKQKPLKFCSSKCRENWWRKHKDKAVRKSAVSVTCAGCGKSFTAYEHEKRKYCSHECYVAARFKGGERDA